MSIAVLLLCGRMTKMSHSAGASRVSSHSLGGPAISSLLGMEATATLSILPLLLVEVGSSRVSTNAMGMHVLLTSRWSTSHILRRIL